MSIEYFYIYNNKKYIYKYKPTFTDFVQWFVTKYNIPFLKAKEIVETYIDHEQEMVFFDSRDRDLLVEICYDNATKKFQKDNQNFPLTIKLDYK